VTLDEALLQSSGPDVDVLALDRALTALARLDPQQARIVELRFFGGQSVEEVAETLDISPATVKRHWTVAKAWLLRELRGGGDA
jgi:RNA polymerase sigma factor (sigma-70 family)